MKNNDNIVSQTLIKETIKKENMENENTSSTNTKIPMDRRTFCTKCFSYTAGILLLSTPGVLAQALTTAELHDEIKPKVSKKEIRKLFMQKGSCSHLFFYVMNYEYGHNKNFEERAIDQLAGGLAGRGYQCGMLWGTSMGASAEAYRIYKNKDRAIAGAVFTSKQIIDAFTEITNSPDCIEITKIDPAKAFSKLKMIFSAGDCFRLANEWYPKAVKTTDKCLTQNFTVQNNLTTCASEVVKKMGGNNEEMVMVSGFAGGLGLSGNACGALAAAIWMKTLDWCRKNPEKRGYSYEGVEVIITKFEEATQGELLCQNICGKSFNSIEDHTEFIRTGGCKRIIDLLAETKTSID